MFLRSFVKINLLFRIMDPLKRKSPPAGAHKAEWTDAKAWETQDTQKKNKSVIHKRSYRLGTVSKNILLGRGA